MFIAKIPYRASFGRALDALRSTTRRSEAIVCSHGQRSPMRAWSSAGPPEPDETLLPKEDFSTHKFPALGLEGVYASKRARAESRAELKNGEKAKHLRIQRYSVTRYFEGDSSGNGAPSASSDEYTPLHSSQEADAQQRQGSTPRQRQGRTIRINTVTPFGQVTLHLKRFVRGGDGMEKDREYPSYLPWPPDITWATGKLMRQYEAFKRAREGKDVDDPPLLRIIVITTIKEFGKLATVRRRGRLRVHHAVRTAARDMDAAETKCLDGALLVIRPHSICAERPRPSAPPPTLQEGEVPKSKRASASKRDTKGRSEMETRSRENAIHMDDLVRSALDLLKSCVAESQTRDGRAKRGGLETARSSAPRRGKKAHVDQG